MMKKVALLVAALTLALPAFADTTTATNTVKTPAPKGSAPKRSRSGMEVRSFSMPVTAPVDNRSSGQVVGKRKHKLVPVTPPK
jgi:hypothetical protein